MSIARLSHIGICVSDLERSISFYRDLLGFREVCELDVAGEGPAKLLGLEEVELQARYLERDGTRIELLHYPVPGHVEDDAPRPMNRVGLTHLSFRVEDLASTLSAIEEAGFEILRDTHIDTPAVKVGVVFVLDPDGCRVELVQSPGDPALLPGQKPS